MTDYDFAEEFSASLATILAQPKPYKVRWHPRKNRWIVQGSSILLYNFLSCDWRDLKKWIEHCSRCRAAFLRAFYDAEGSVSGRKLSLHNTKKALLLYIQDLLKQHRIETSRLYLRRSAGTALLDPGSGKVYFRRKDGFSFIVRTKSLSQFAKEIGFSIERKQRRLCEAARSWGEDIDHHTRQLLLVTVDKKRVDVSPPSKIGDSERSKGSDSSRNCLRM